MGIAISFLTFFIIYGAIENVDNEWSTETRKNGEKNQDIDFLFNSGNHK